jgi:hypothetical protein
MCDGVDVVFEKGGRQKMSYLKRSYLKMNYLKRSFLEREEC